MACSIHHFVSGLSGPRYRATIHMMPGKTIAPLCPELAFVLPLSPHCIHRIQIGIRLHQAFHLLLNKPQGVVEKLPVRFVNELNHASPALRVIIEAETGRFVNIVRNERESNHREQWAHSPGRRFWAS